MRLFIQRVLSASVGINGRETAAIGPGLLALAAFGSRDGADFARRPAFAGMARKLWGLRIFPPAGEREGKFVCDVQDYGGDLLIVPQFTLYADCRKGRRPSFSDAAAPEQARGLFAEFVNFVDENVSCRVASGIFGADMRVQLCNWGPVTILLDSEELFPSSDGVCGRDTSCTR